MGFISGGINLLSHSEVIVEFVMAYSAPRLGPGGVEQCVMKVELRFECFSLKNKDLKSLSDPCAVLSMKRGGKAGHKWYEIGRTENIKNTLKPQFCKVFEVDYYFEEVQKVRIDIYDLDNRTPTLRDDDFLGGHECTLGQIVAGNPYKRPLVYRSGRPAGQGMVLIHAEELTGSNEHLLLDFEAKDLDKKDLIGKSDPFFEVHKINHDGSGLLLHRTEVKTNTLKPNWKPFHIPMRSLQNAGGEHQLRISVFDHDTSGSHELIGVFTTNRSDLLQAMQRVKQWECINPKKQAKKKNYRNSGLVILKSATIVKEHTFLDFIFGGLQLNFTVGIDFTGSNGNPLTRGTLHYMDPYAPNEYQQAIAAVGAVCQDYDTDKLFPALGFGARIPPSNQLSHEFPLNFNPENPFCFGVQGILEAYRNCLPVIGLSGPTNIAPIINHVARFARSAEVEERHAYYILLLMTDGVITDMNETRQAIVEASSLPMSLIIVGVGGADFSDMNMLDGDDGVLRSAHGKPVARDIVQFVPYRVFSCGPDFTGPELARHVLAEVPKQVTGYMKMRRIAPGIPQVM